MEVWRKGEDKGRQGGRGWGGGGGGWEGLHKANKRTPHPSLNTHMRT